MEEKFTWRIGDFSQEATHWNCHFSKIFTLGGAEWMLSVLKSFSAEGQLEFCLIADREHLPSRWRRDVLLSLVLVNQHSPSSSITHERRCTFQGKSQGWYHCGMFGPPGGFLRGAKGFLVEDTMIVEVSLAVHRATPPRQRKRNHSDSYIGVFESCAPRPSGTSSLENVAKAERSPQECLPSPDSHLISLGPSPLRASEIPRLEEVYMATHSPTECLPSPDSRLIRLEASPLRASENPRLEETEIAAHSPTERLPSPGSHFSNSETYPSRASEIPSVEDAEMATDSQTELLPSPASHFSNSETYPSRTSGIPSLAEVEMAARSPKECLPSPDPHLISLEASTLRVSEIPSSEQVEMASQSPKECLPSPHAHLSNSGASATVASEIPSVEDVEKGKQSLKECLSSPFFHLGMKEKLAEALSTISSSADRAGLSGTRWRFFMEFHDNFESFVAPYEAFEKTSLEFVLAKMETEERVAAIMEGLNKAMEGVNAKKRNPVPGLNACISQLEEARHTCVALRDIKLKQAGVTKAKAERRKEASAIAWFKLKQYVLESL